MKSFGGGEGKKKKPLKKVIKKRLETKSRINKQRDGAMNKKKRKKKERKS